MTRTELETRVAEAISLAGGESLEDRHPDGVDEESLAFLEARAAIKICFEAVAEMSNHLLSHAVVASPTVELKRLKKGKVRR